jgi:PAS domain S-box-containing protein
MSETSFFPHDDDSPMTALLNRSTDGIVIVDSAGRILFVNPAAAGIFGRSYEELVGSDLGLPLIKSEKTEIEILNKQEGLRWVEMMTTETHWYEVPVRLAVLHDITREVEAERQRRVSERKFTEIFQISPEPILITRLEDGTVLDANPALLATLGLPQEDCIGKTTVELGLWSSYEQRSEFLEEVSEAGMIQRRERSFDINGRVRTFLISSTVLDFEGERSALSIMRDITEIREQQQNLEQAKLEAEHANRAKSDFLANMSHEIRTPMNAIIGSSHILMNTPLDSEQQEYVNTVIQSGNHLLTLIDDILDFSKIEAGKLSLHEELFDLGAVTNEVIDLVSHKATGKNLEIVNHLDPRIPGSLYGDTARLRQILVNLVGNAVKFTPEGEVIIKEVLEERSGSGITLHLEIIDTGIGISREQLDELFSPFSQADSSATRSYGGTGLGLSIVKRLSEIMGGTVAVESVQGTGSRFTVTLPFGVPRDSPDVSDSYRALSAALSGLRVLIMDDSGAHREMLNEVLSHAGAECWEAENPAAARRLLRAGTSGGGTAADGRETAGTAGTGGTAGAAGETADSGEATAVPFDIILIDETMPEGEVHAFAGEVKRLPGGEAADLILMTGIDSAMDRSRCSEYGYSALLPKPVKQSRLTKVLLQVTGGTAPQDESSAQDSLPASAADDSTVSASVPGSAASSTLSAAAERQRSNALYRPSNSAYRILVVEDNAINRNIAVRSLEKRGYTVEWASGGEEAVSSAEREHYDLIFMDVQMPGMDGFEATGRIRMSSGSATPPGVPIIAMTAHTFKEDRERCLAAGMNDFLGKPVGPEKLKEKLETWLPAEEFPAEKFPAEGPADLPAGGSEEEAAAEPAGGSGSGQEAAAEPGRAEQEVFDLASFMETTHHDEEHLRELTEAFLRDIPEHLREIRAAAAEVRWNEVSSIAHAVKGVAMTFAMGRLQHAAEQLDHTARRLARSSSPPEADGTQGDGAQVNGYGRTSGSSASSGAEAAMQLVEELERAYGEVEKVLRRQVRLD